jgi:uncharacterized protein
VSDRRRQVLAELKLTVKGDGVEFEVRAKPNAKRTSIVGVREGILDVRVAARPVEGAANEELLAFLADELGVPHRDVRLVQGGSSRHKRVQVLGLGIEGVRTRLMR